MLGASLLDGIRQDRDMAGVRAGTGVAECLVYNSRGLTPHNDVHSIGPVLAG
jgi:hypothetical protein